MNRLLIIGGSQPTAVGASLRRAALSHSDIEVSYIDYGDAFTASKLFRRLSWHLLDKRPPRLSRFNSKVRAAIATMRPDVVFCAGNVVLTGKTFAELKRVGATSIVWLTDDPWNPAHKSQRFLTSISSYGFCLTPRKSNIEEIARLNPSVHYMPFGYDSAIFAAQEKSTARPTEAHAVFFAGGADSDRIPIMEALARSGLSFGLYGGLWNKWPALRGVHRGYATPHELVWHGCEAKIALCLVRRANRDGHSMRTFELGALGACMLVERTPEHEEIFGCDGESVRFFADETDVVNVAKELMESPELRARLKVAVRDLIRGGRHSYSDRFAAILGLLQENTRA